MRNSKRKIAGVVSIEFALGFMALWTLIAGWIEASYISYVSALGDYAIAEASRAAKKETSNYLTVFKNIIDDDNALWSGWVDSSDYTIRINYVTDLDGLEAIQECASDSSATEAECGTEAWSEIAVYYVSYNYDGIFAFLTGDNTVFDREVIVVQEYQRDQFIVNGTGS